MTIKYIFLSALMLVPAGIQAQSVEQALQGQLIDPVLPTNGEGRYRYADAMQLWRNTQNAASMTLDTVRNRGYAEMRLEHMSGDYHRVQEGRQTNAFLFSTERYQRMGRHLYGYGRFEFRNGRTKERAWSDVMRTYNSNPFISGSSVLGKYDFQDFDLAARVGTRGFGAWRFGVGLDYRVGDLSRLRDPRSRSRLLDYRLTPSLSFTEGSHTVGLAGWYHRYKEKIPNIKTVQNDPTLYYYQMTGLDVITGTVGGYNGFSREYVNHNFGAELQYGYQSGRWRSVNAMSIERGTEHVWEQYKREPGQYTTYLYKLSTQNRIVANDMIHQIDLAAEYQQGYADEFRPVLVITTDPVHGYTSQRYDNQFTYKKRFQLKTFDIDLRYRLNFTDGVEVKRYVGLQGHLSTVSQKHLLPTSKFNLGATDIRAEYGQSLFSGRRLWLMLGGGMHLALKADLRLSDATSDYAQSVLLKDMVYYDSNYWTGNVNLMYQFPLTVKGHRSLWYVRAYGEMLRAQHNLDRNTVGIAVGLFN